MSSTNRANAKERHTSDYYVTPQSEIKLFLDRWMHDEELFDRERTWRDPCAGGDEKNEMSYPAVLQKQGVTSIDTIDIREDSPADTWGDFLSMDLDPVDITITNPPFNVAEEIIRKALATTVRGGVRRYVTTS
jgi:hypothetical protein